MGYGKDGQSSFLSRRTGTLPKWTPERLEAKRRQIEKGTTQEEITKTVEETLRKKGGV